jgi:type IV pilus biogenesis protein CpaD/CtpE
MVKKWPVVALMAVLCGLAGCTSSSSSAKPGKTTTTRKATPAKTTKVTVKPTATATETRMSEFPRIVRDKLPEIAAGRQDTELQAIADTACEGLAAKKSADAIVDVTRTLGTLDAEATDHVTARELVKLAIDTTCFEQRGRVDEF